ncbi:hypothetical protein CBER1_02171 [Cercospora berteroae]|uniref:Uncharacterized protein n=1 Tax=Cercospora berteroae TaxID=357750 RepID=A0A2S6BQ88_9PEZI|nr:hypothetical protein CBER1_02171 [Cercospora berteroae]
MAISRLFAVSIRPPDGNKIHCRTPALMMSSLVVGAAFSIGHHAFYSSLQSTEVRSTPYQFAGWQITSQQLNTAGGTAFAFAVKASLVLAISPAYVQLFFRAVAKLGRDLACIDSWFSGLGDITSLLLPIATLTTPATLSVTFDELPLINESHFVPIPAFASLKIADYIAMPAIGQLSAYGPAIVKANRIVQAVVLGGSILPIPPLAVNASWTVTIPAPRLACEHANDTLLGAIRENPVAALKPRLASGNWSASSGSYGFAEEMFSHMSWTGSTGNEPDPLGEEPFWLEMPFSSGLSPFSKDYNVSEDVNDDELDQGFDRGYIGRDNVLYVAVLRRLVGKATDLADALLTAMMGSDISTITGVHKAMNWSFEGASVVRCELRASEYTLRFASSGASQEQDIAILHVADVALDLGNPTLPMTWFGVTDSGCLYPRQAIGPGTECYIDTDYLLKISYNAMMNSFAELLTGAINSNGYSEGSGVAVIDMSEKESGPDYLTYRTRILLTSLVDAVGLALLSRVRPNVENTIGDGSPRRAVEEAYSLFQTSLQPARMDLKDAIEELFFNVTISMASSPMFTYNITAPNAPENVAVTISKMGNIYSYSADKLWLAYGLAIGITIINVGFGLLAIFRTGASFTLNFSTIVRAAKNADVSLETDEQVLPGKDPLPKEWKRATFEIRPNAAYEVHSLKSGVYSSVNQSGEERDRSAREDYELRPGGQIYESYDDRRRI